MLEEIESSKPKRLSLRFAVEAQLQSGDTLLEAAAEPLDQEPGELSEN